MDSLPKALRERTVRWDDPAVSAAAVKSLSGIDFLRAIHDGKLPRPPALLLLGIELGEIEHGRITMHLPPAEYLYNPIGSVHGGMISTILDSVMGCAVQSTLAQGRGYTTLELKVNFLRALTQRNGTVAAEGKVVHGGRQTALAEAKLVGADGKLYASASSTCLVFDIPGASVA